MSAVALWTVLDRHERTRAHDQGRRAFGTRAMARERAPPADQRADPDLAAQRARGGAGTRRQDPRRHRSPTRRSAAALAALFAKAPFPVVVVRRGGDLSARLPLALTRERDAQDQRHDRREGPHARRRCRARLGVVALVCMYVPDSREHDEHHLYAERRVPGARARGRDPRRGSSTRRSRPAASTPANSSARRPGRSSVARPRRTCAPWEPVPRARTDRRPRRSRRARAD